MSTSNILRKAIKKIKEIELLKAKPVFNQSEIDKIQTEKYWKELFKFHTPRSTKEIEKEYEERKERQNKIHMEKQKKKDELMEKEKLKNQTEWEYKQKRAEQERKSQQEWQNCKNKKQKEKQEEFERTRRNKKPKFEKENDKPFNPKSIYDTIPPIIIKEFGEQMKIHNNPDKAFRQLSRKYHPDKNLDNIKWAEEMSKHLSNCRDKFKNIQMFL